MRNVGHWLLIAVLLKNYELWYLYVRNEAKKRKSWKPVQKLMYRITCNGQINAVTWKGFVSYFNDHLSDLTRASKYDIIPFTHPIDYSIIQFETSPPSNITNISTTLQTTTIAFLKAPSSTCISHHVDPRNPIPPLQSRVPKSRHVRRRHHPRRHSNMVQELQSHRARSSQDGCRISKRTSSLLSPNPNSTSPLLTTLPHRSNSTPTT